MVTGACFPLRLLEERTAGIRGTPRNISAQRALPHPQHCLKVTP